VQGIRRAGHGPQKPVVWLFALLAVAAGCGRAAPPVAAPRPAIAARAPRAEADAGPASPPGWPAPLAAVLARHGAPHGEAISLGHDSGGRDLWLGFVGTDEVALGAWRVTLASDGKAQVEPVARWPTGVRVLGGVERSGVAYVLMESLAVLDQPAGLRGVWTGLADRAAAPPTDASPLAFDDVTEVADIAARLDSMPPPAASLERNAGTLLETLRAASASPQALVRELPKEGADLQTAWQTVFVRTVAHIGAGGGAPDKEVADRALGLVRDVLGTQACGLDECEAWTDKGRSVVRFESRDGRWMIRSLIEDATVTPAAAGRTPAREVESSPDADATRALLEMRVNDVRQILGQAPLDAEGDTIGVALTDASPDSPSLALREGLAGRVFGLDVGPVRAHVQDATWDASFADVDGDGRTDVALHMRGSRADGTPLAWTQVFLAPPPSVQSSSVEPDLASAFAVMDAPDARSAARIAASLPARAVTREEACKVLASATTLAGFHRAATPTARLLLFQEPGRPTWRPKVVPLAKIAAGDVHGFAAHCAEMTCDRTRPYCSYSVPGDSLHVWFAWTGGRLAIEGVADYSGE
jgi:hypothetical protein